MNIARVLIVTSILLTSACDYKVPLSTEHTIPIDEAALGLWQEVTEEGSNDDRTSIRILRYSDTEYLVMSSTRASSLYFRAYLINVADCVLLQAEIIAEDGKPPGEKDNNLFSVVSYAIEGDELTFASLSARVVDSEISNSQALMEAFIREKDNPELFTDFARYRKIESKAP